MRSYASAGGAAMPQMIVARVVLTVLAISLAIGLGMGLARAQTPGATFVFHARPNARQRFALSRRGCWRSTDFGGALPARSRVRPRRARLLGPGEAHPPEWDYTSTWCSWIIDDTQFARHRRHGGLRRRLFSPWAILVERSPIHLRVVRHSTRSRRAFESCTRRVPGELHNRNRSRLVGHRLAGATRRR